METTTGNFPLSQLSGAKKIHLIPLTHFRSRPTSWAESDFTKPLVESCSNQKITIDEDALDMFIQVVNSKQERESMKQYRLVGEETLPVQLPNDQSPLVLVSTRDFLNVIGHELMEIKCTPKLVMVAKRIQEWRYSFEAPVTMIVLQ